MGRLQTARLENFIRRWGSIKGPGSVLSETLGDVFPVLDLENLSPENYLPAGWYPFMIFATAVGVAAQLTGVSVINPANSGSILVVDEVRIRAQSAGTVTFGSAQPLFTAVANSTQRDTRSAPFSGVARIGADVNVAAVELGLIVRVAATVDTVVTLPHGVAILAPNSQLAVVASAANIDLTVGFSGRVRVAEPSELSF